MTSLRVKSISSHHSIYRNWAQTHIQNPHSKKKSSAQLFGVYKIVLENNNPLIDHVTVASGLRGQSVWSMTSRRSMKPSYESTDTCPEGVMNSTPYITNV